MYNKQKKILQNTFIKEVRILKKVIELSQTTFGHKNSKLLKVKQLNKSIPNTKITKNKFLISVLGYNVYKRGSLKTKI